MKKMDPELKAQWVAALRSGKYEQGRGRLERDGKYCCLGVLREVMGGDCAFREEFQVLWGKPYWRRVEVEIDGVIDTLPDHNDSGRTFTEIADAIEDQL